MIVVIAILAAISVVAYNGIQQRARQAKVDSDLSMLQKAIVSARINQDKMLMDLTGNTYTAAQCSNKTSINNLSEVPKSDACWTTYANTLSIISSLSGMNVNGLVDPFGQPYMIDENETTTVCTRDQLGTYNIPYSQGAGGQTRSVLIGNYRTNC